MAQIILTVPDDQYQRVIDSYAKQYGFGSRAEGDETKEEFCKRKVFEHLRKPVEDVECSDVSDRAVASRRATIRSDIPRN